MYEINPEYVGWQYLSSKKMLPKIRQAYQFVCDPISYPKYMENVRIIRNDA